MKGLSEAMLRLVQSPELRQQLGEGSQQRVRSNYFDWDSKVDRTVEIFREVLGLPATTDESQVQLPEKQPELSGMNP
ncbi:glycosyltransferase [Egbenema bharatensis]|uniref:glycosyltransferase n=1 Tax=Egbenema bharatensis TaxID=3463334 RepID=UPI003A8C063B